MPNINEGRPLSDLVGGLVTDISGLFRKEVDLAKAEASEKISRAVGGVELLVVGMIFAIGAVGVLLGALVAGIAAFLVAQGMAEANASALSAVIVGVVVAGAAWIMLSRGLAVLSGTEIAFNRTAASLRRDAEVVKERL